MRSKAEKNEALKAFVEKARQGDFGGYKPLEDIIYQPSIQNGRTAGNSAKRLRALARSIIKSAGRAYPHKIKAMRLQGERERHRTANPSLSGMNADTRAIRVFQSFSPLIALAAAGLLVQSFQIALLMTTVALLLAAIRVASEGKVEWQRRLWDGAAGLYVVAATIFAVINAGVSENIIWLLGLCTIVPLLTVCFSGRQGLEAIALLWFLMRDWWKGVRIAWENVAFWLPRRIYRVETSLQEYINLANTTGLPVGPFSIATRDVLTQWFGYDPFPDGNIPAPQPNENLPPQPQPAPVNYEQVEEPIADENAEAAYYKDLLNRRMRDDEGQVS
jgi:hypothetical protein